MGIDIHVRLVKKNRETNTWEQIKLYYKNKDQFKLVDIYPFRHYELFDILTGKEDYIASNIELANLPEDLSKEIEKYKHINGYYDFKEATLADLKLYLYKVPKVRDWDYEDYEDDNPKAWENDPKAWKDNPVKSFIERIERYLDFVDWSWDEFPASDIKILYWFDC